MVARQESSVNAEAIGFEPLRDGITFPLSQIKYRGESVQLAHEFQHVHRPHAFQAAPAVLHLIQTHIKVPMRQRGSCANASPARATVDSQG